MEKVTKIEIPELSSFNYSTFRNEMLNSASQHINYYLKFRGMFTTHLRKNTSLQKDYNISSL